MIRRDILTFIIPVSIDVMDRIRNLNFVVRYILDNFDSDILVGEFSKARSIFFAEKFDRVRFLFSECDVFSKTKALNILNLKVSTEYVCSCDSDIICPVSSINSAIRKLQFGYDAVVPYTGPIYSTSVDNPFSKNSIYSNNSYGGIILYNLDRFKRAGMENENFVGWGYEDYERWKRLEILGYRICRIEGPLYHLKHFIRKKDAAQIERNRMEYKKVCSMSKGELERYVSSWEHYIY